VLGWTSVLTASHGAVRIASPAVNGRPGAGYGGIFWRLPNRPDTAVLSAGGPGEAVGHGSASPWLALNQLDGARRVGLLLTQPASLARPWFVRATEYTGAGPMLAAESAVTIEPGDSLSTSLVGVVLDRWVADAADAEGILRAADLVEDLAGQA
jgi:LacI family transcriptional regulator